MTFIGIAMLVITLVGLGYIIAMNVQAIKTAKAVRVREEQEVMKAVNARWEEAKRSAQANRQVYSKPKTTYTSNQANPPSSPPPRIMTEGGKVKHQENRRRDEDDMAGVFPLTTAPLYNPFFDDSDRYSESTSNSCTRNDSSNNDSSVSHDSGSSDSGGSVSCD